MDETVDGLEEQDEAEVPFILPEEVVLSLSPQTSFQWSSGSHLNL